LLISAAPSPSAAGTAAATFAPVAPVARADRFPADRAALNARLQSRGGRHVVIVRYEASHNPHQEWVYNAADIDASSVVWARDRGDCVNRRLLDYYRVRSLWLLEPDRAPDCLTPYDAH
jgi:hypothetical protein